MVSTGLWGKRGGQKRRIWLQADTVSGTASKLPRKTAGRMHRDLKSGKESSKEEPFFPRRMSLLKSPLAPGKKKNMRGNTHQSYGKGGSTSPHAERQIAVVMPNGKSKTSRRQERKGVGGNWGCTKRKYLGSFGTTAMHCGARTCERSPKGEEYERLPEA